VVFPVQVAFPAHRLHDAVGVFDPLAPGLAGKPVRVDAGECIGIHSFIHILIL
jgi:hypothetical protein